MSIVSFIELDSSKCLTKRNKDLCSLDSGDGVQVVSDINANGSNRSGVAHAESYSIGIVGSEVAEPDVPKHVSSVIKGSYAEAFLEWNGYAELRIDNEQLASTRRHPDERTG